MKGLRPVSIKEIAETIRKLVGDVKISLSPLRRWEKSSARAPFFHFVGGRNLANLISGLFSFFGLLIYLVCSLEKQGQLSLIRTNKRIKPIFLKLSILLLSPLRRWKVRWKVRFVTLYFLRFTVYLVGLVYP